MNISRNSGGPPPSPAVSIKYIEPEEAESKRQSTEAGWLRRFKATNANTVPIPRRNSGKQIASSSPPANTPSFSMFRSKTAPLTVRASDAEERLQAPACRTDEAAQLLLARKDAAHRRVESMRAFLTTALGEMKTLRVALAAVAQSASKLQKPRVFPCAVADPAHPPLREDILWLTITPIAELTLSIPKEDQPFACQICDRGFNHDRKEPAGRLHNYNNEVHLVHKGCLEKGLGDTSLRCPRCEALRRQMGKYGAEEVRKRISRIEWTLSNRVFGTMRRQDVT